MENIILFRQAKKDILQKLIESKVNVTTVSNLCYYYVQNHKNFDIQIKKYR